MASGTSDKLKHVGQETLDTWRGQKGGAEVKKGWDSARGAKRKRREERSGKEAALALGPVAETTAGATGTEQLLKRKGRSSTQKISRSPLGGGSSLT